MFDLVQVTARLTWLDTPSDNSHHIGGALHFCRVVDVQLHITATQTQCQMYRDTETLQHYCFISIEMCLMVVFLLPTLNK